MYVDELLEINVPDLTKNVLMCDLSNNHEIASRL